MSLNVHAERSIYEALTKNAHKYQGVSKYDETWVARVAWVRNYGQEGLDSVLLNTKLFARWMRCEHAAATAAVSIPASVVAAAVTVIVATVAEVLIAPVEEEEKKKVVESVAGPAVVGELEPELSSEVEAEREGDETVAAEPCEEENQDLPALVPADSGADMSEPCGALVAVQVECLELSFVEETTKDEVVEKKQIKKRAGSNVVLRAMKSAIARLLPCRNTRVQAIWGGRGLRRRFGFVFGSLL
ncbi:hypothetical protein AMAG_04962 [Allomyces macrogynus ATCC 38327]|uniref:Uncharacterized protein n=1 Tax=Allomyces macrogynus (strain ATCC 38327) TaxID=578462 RepID=A0A0L0S6L1_ALLM3|nr:hypothetical protein AMAG_04962 [Allomyces macrogynus ATCC 38327]|eukprot:KNE58147.1 hypothetical protein AMAG_04962 [Allomyces macrogynus ATCC 38327]